MVNGFFARHGIQGTRIFSKASSRRAKSANGFVERLESRALLSAGLSATAQLHLLSTTGTPASPLYHYDITLNNTGTTDIGTFWFAWIPGGDFLPSVPASESSPSGWGDSTGKPFVTGSGNSFDGSALQWISQSSASNVKAGTSLSGFDFTTADSPSVLAGKAPSNTAHQVMESFVYIGSPFADPGFDFTVTEAASGPTAAKLAIASQPTTAIAGVPLAPIKADVESASNSIITGDSSKMNVSIASGPAGIAPGSTVTATAVHGVATFSNVKLDVAGTYTLKFSDGSLTPAVTKTITISPAAAAKLVVATQPTAGTAGKALTPISVKVEDAFGNVETGNTSIVKLAATSAPAGGAVSGTLSAPAVKGIATFNNLSMKVAGTYTLRATDGALTAAVSKPITIAAAAAAKLVITQQPTTAKAGIVAVPSFIVKVEDIFGNVAITNSSTVTLSISAGPVGGSLLGTVSVKAVKGIATFPNLAFKKAGTYKLKASDGTLTLALSKNILVS